MKKLAFLYIFIIALLLPGPTGCRQPGEMDAAPPAEPLVVAPSTHEDLLQFFAHVNYDLDNLLEEGVPKFIVRYLPDDLDSIAEVREKKRVFFLTLLPMVLLANEEIIAEREQLLDIFARHDSGALLESGETDFVSDLVEKYRLSGDPLGEVALRTRLLKRVDILPPSLVLAQAANESGWGTSRFALLGNNLFGEWTFTPGTGIVPEGRPDGETYEVKSFPTLFDSVQSYLRNINTHPAYHQLRDIRARMREEDRPLVGVELARGLTGYSIRREEYVREIAAMIRHNRLSLLSQVNLRN